MQTFRNTHGQAVSSTSLWRIVDAAILSPTLVSAQTRRDIVARVRELEQLCKPKKTSALQLQAAAEAQAAVGESFGRVDRVPPDDADRRRIRRQLAEKRYAQRVYDDLSLGERHDRIAQLRAREARRI